MLDVNRLISIDVVINTDGIVKPVSYLRAELTRFFLYFICVVFNVVSYFNSFLFDNKKNCACLSFSCLQYSNRFIWKYFKGFPKFVCNTVTCYNMHSYQLDDMLVKWLSINFIFFVSLIFSFYNTYYIYCTTYMFSCVLQITWLQKRI